MHSKIPAASAVVLVTSLAALSPAAASDWNGSYAAEGRCFCSGTLSSSVASALVPTPVGSQSVANVCERVGTGPQLVFEDGRFNHVVYPDAQCGNGPSASDLAVNTACAGTLEPGSGDCQPPGPGWDLAAAYSEPAGVAEDPQPLAAANPPADAGQTGSSAASARTVVVDGQSWREAPAGTSELGGDAGSRIILDGKLWLKADDPVFALADSRSAVAAKPVVAEVGSAPGSTRIEASPAPVVVKSPETRSDLAERQKELLAAARERARQRKEAQGGTYANVEPAQPEPEVAAAQPESTSVIAEQESGATVAESVAEVPATSDDETAVGVVAESVEAGSSSTESAPLSALRLPLDARGSSHDFAYVQAMPVSFDFGGGGLAVAGTAEIGDRFHLIARGAAANKYREAEIGAGFHYTPPAADRMTLSITGGIEYGVFPLSNDEVQVDDEDTGVFLKLANRLVLNRSFELEGGVGYSSFFGGDPNLFGGAYFHINRNVDLISAFELGDNDNFGLGLRVYY